jgi:putative SOS response-associated peptidase YedK
MCGRTTLTRADLSEIADELGVAFSATDKALYRPRYNAAPTDLSWVLLPAAEGPRLAPAVWGLPSNRRPIINVTAERVCHGALKSRSPCLAVVDGFYEWGPGLRPYWYRAPGGSVFLLAGLEEPLNTSTKAPRAFTIITAEAGPDVAPIHDRMPVVIPRDKAASWLEHRELDLLAPSPAGTLTVQEVSRRVNKVANDDPGCIGPPEPSNERRRPRQLSLLEPK